MKPRYLGMRKKHGRRCILPPKQTHRRTVARTIQYQRVLDDANGRLRLLSAHTHGIIFELDSEVRFVRIWASDPQLLARPESECLGRTIPEVLGADVGLRHHEAAKETVKTGISVSYEYELNVPSGHRHFSCESVAVPAGVSNGYHAVFWIRDITAQVQLQNKLSRTERLASVGALAAGVAHEINNPLAYMMLNTEQLQRTFCHLNPIEPIGERLEAMKNCVSMIHEGARHVKRIVNELLQLAKPDDPSEPVDVLQAIELSLDFTKAIWRNRAKVNTEWEEVPFVLAHQGRLVQVFNNLLTNAAEAMTADNSPGNEIFISACRVAPNIVRVEFRDTGTGISQETQQHIFEPFFTTKPHGTGLGLTICQRIVSSFNGEIRVEKLRPRGSAVSVLLPVA